MNWSSGYSTIMVCLCLQVILSDIRSEGPLSVVEVQVESVSMSAVCGLHHAILRRVQVHIHEIRTVSSL